jgi:hypothetical protein
LGRRSSGNNARVRAVGIGIQAAAIWLWLVFLQVLNLGMESSWTVVASLNSPRYGGATAGTQTAGLYSGGDLPPNTAKTESWDGTSWTEVADLATARRRFIWFRCSRFCCSIWWLYNNSG